MTEPNSPGNGDGNAPGNAPTNPPATAPVVPAQSPVPPAQSQTSDFAGLATLLSALPEKVAHAVREAMPAPPKPEKPAPPAAPAAPANPAPNSGASTVDNKPGAQSFREWWFSGSGKR